MGIHRWRTGLGCVWKATTSLGYCVGARVAAGAEGWRGEARGDCLLWFAEAPRGVVGLFTPCVRARGVPSWPLRCPL